MIQRVFTLTAALLLSAPAIAGWQLDKTASELSFVSIKAGNVAEVHRFGELSGELLSDGSFAVAIELDSVDTNIEIRDERMRSLLFDTERFPSALVSGDLDMSLVADLRAGESLRQAVEGMLSLHGQHVALTAELFIGKLADDRIVVASMRPVVLNATSFDLAAGVEELRAIAGLPSISEAVPVSFVLTFVAAD